MEIPIYRLSHKIYPIFGEKNSGDRGLNRFPITFEQITPPLEDDVQYHEIVFRVSNPNGLMEPTYYNDVKIISTRNTRILAVPCEAVHKNGDNFFVYTLDEEDRLAKREVSIGFKDDLFTEVTDGIEQGTLVVLADEKDYAADTKVRIKENEFGADLSK